MIKIFLATFIFPLVCFSSTSNCHFSTFLLSTDHKEVSVSFEVVDRTDTSLKSHFVFSYPDEGIHEYKQVPTIQSPGDNWAVETPKQMLKEIKDGNPWISARWKEILKKMISAQSTDMYSFPFTFRLRDTYIYRYYDSSNREIGKIYAGNSILAVCD